MYLTIGNIIITYFTVLFIISIIVRVWWETLDPKKKKEEEKGIYPIIGILIFWPIMVPVITILLCIDNAGESIAKLLNIDNKEKPEEEKE